MTTEDDFNPFSTRCVRPGAIEFRFEAGVEARQLVERLAAQQWRGQIIGPHGTGKSTLLRTLVPWLEQAGRQLVLVSLSPGQRWWRPTATQARSWNEQTLIVIDGYEQLNAWSRWRWRNWCRRRRVGLLVTAHQDVGLPTLFQSGVALEVAQAIVRDLQRGAVVLVGPDDVATAVEARQGNLREALFDLYDLYELRRRRSPS